MEIQKFIEKYRISMGSEGHLIAHDVPLEEKEEVISFAQSNRDEIIARIKEQPKHQEVLQGMEEGLAAIKRAIAARDSKIATISIMGARGINAQKDAIQKVEREFTEKVSKYPREYAYFKAKRMADSSNKWRKLAGERAARKILDGENSEEAIRQMEKEWRSDISKDVRPGECIRDSIPYSILGRNENGVRASRRATTTI